MTAIDPESLRAQGIRGVILDLDNTLVPWRSREIAAEVADWVRRVRTAGLRLCILSNTHRLHRLRQLAAALDMPYVPGSSKPRRPGFLKAVEILGVPAEQIVVIGDQVLTDVWGGNRCGMRTVLVDRLTEREFVATRWISRSIEAVLLRCLRQRGLLKELTTDR